VDLVDTGAEQALLVVARGGLDALLRAGWRSDQAVLDALPRHAADARDLRTEHQHVQEGEHAEQAGMLD
jgi:hypothetical protein